MIHRFPLSRQRVCDSFSDVMPERRRVYLWAALGLLWLIAMGWSLYRSASAWNRLDRAAEHLETLTRDSHDITRTVRSLTEETSASHRENEFLQSLVNVLPHEKGFIRTQRAM